MTTETYVTLRVLDDVEGRSWWEALALPDPAYWNTHDGAVFQSGCHVEPVLEVERARVSE